MSATPQTPEPGRRPRHVRGPLIAAGLLVVLTGCGKKTPVDARAEVQKMIAEVPGIITDSTRAALVENAYRRLGDVMLQTIDERRRISTRWNQLYRRYDTPRESLEVLVAATNDASSRARAAAIQTREEVRTHTSEQEWKALGATRKRAANLYLLGSP